MEERKRASYHNIVLLIYRSFGGFLNDTLEQENLGELADDIGDSSKYIKNPYFTAGYDNPYQVFDRHNEVWLLQA